MGVSPFLVMDGLLLAQREPLKSRIGDAIASLLSVSHGAEGVVRCCGIGSKPGGEPIKRVAWGFPLLRANEKRGRRVHWVLVAFCRSTGAHHLVFC